MLNSTLDRLKKPRADLRKSPSSTSAASAEEAEDRIGWDRSVRPRPSTETQTGTKEGRIGAETGRPLGKIFNREYILRVSVELLNEH